MVKFGKIIIRVVTNRGVQTILHDAKIPPIFIFIYDMYKYYRLAINYNYVDENYLVGSVSDVDMAEDINIKHRQHL